MSNMSDTTNEGVRPTRRVRLDAEFEPETVSWEVGETVTWVWEGGATHNVVGDGFDSPAQSSGSFRHSFDQAGTYPYECTLHPGMAGEVVVGGLAGNGR
jgi:plastocyanin